MNLDRLSGPALSLFRMVIGLLFLCHGLASVFGLFGGIPRTGEALPVGQWPGWWAGLIQVLCGALVMVGLATRPAALVASGSMAYAYFVVHQPDGLLPLRNGGELAALFCWSFALIMVLGAGPWALDTVLRRRRGQVTRPAVTERNSVPA
ncbi:DoxX family protein [Micromonospora sp. KC606]|uniref:DoxX family protein n=1 Tax=Micromonospora sp. KC606 TaxID=2530379 RepID=UPI001043F0C2|nr:DoxX family protein [Micromonospora sp. KC606]TDC79797.1 DoxX family protein [Micromonospora sp. KC606]